MLISQYTMNKMVFRWLCACAVIAATLHTGSSLSSAPVPSVNKLRDVDWWASGQKELQKSLQGMGKTAKAKNVIFFLGDGMGVSTVTAARMFKAQQDKTSLHDTKLAWDEFPYTSLSKTYNVDSLTPDSAGTATAFFSGCKTNIGLIGMNQKVMKSNCTKSRGNEVQSFLNHAHNKKKWTGLVTTARITHATPSALYAASPSRSWEYDGAIPLDMLDCKDIASQLVEKGDFMKVVLGGGRQYMLPRDEVDPEYLDKTGRRYDGRNLMQEWQKKQEAKVGADKVKVVIDKEGFDNVDPKKVDYLMGVFERSHMQYEVNRAEDQLGEPSLTEMTEKAIQLLQRSQEGYVLMVEGGRIDHGHHSNKAKKALTETLAFSDAVYKAMSMTSREDTLLVVTSDHSHVFTLAGYQAPNNDILGLVRGIKSGTMDELAEKSLGSDGLPYLSLSYANGPGYSYHRTDSDRVPIAGRKDLTFDEDIGLLRDKDFRQDTAVPKSSETHGGEEVAVYAYGPRAGIFHGTTEQSFIAHAVMYALDVTPAYNPCQPRTSHPVAYSSGGSASGAVHRWGLIIGAIVTLLHRYLLV